METVRELLIALGLDVEQAEFVEAIGLEHLLEKAAELLVETLKEIPKALAEVTRETAKYSDELQDASERTGLGTESLQKLGYVAGLAGLQFSDVEISLTHLARTMQGVKDGNKDATATFAKLGVRVQNADGTLRSTDAVMADLADGFQRLPKGAERAATAVDIFGHSGGKMLNVIGKGKGEFNELMAEVEDFGLVMDEEAIARGAELNKEFLRMGMIIDGLKREFAGPLIEALGPIVGELLNWIKANRDLLRQKLLSFARSLATGLKAVARMLAFVGKAALFLVDNWKAVAVVMGALLLALELSGAGFIAMGVSAVIAAASAAGAWIAAAAPVLLLAALLALVALAAEDVYGYLTGADSLIGDIGPKWTKFLDDFTKPREEHWLVATLRQLLGLMTDFQGKWDKFKEDWKFAAREILPMMGIKPIVPLTPEEVQARLKMQGGAAGVDGAAAGAAAARGASGGDVSVEINVHPPPGSSPEAIADSVTEKMSEFFHRKLREAHSTVGAK